MRLLVIDACEVSPTRYDELKQGWLDDLGRPGATSVSHLISSDRSIDRSRRSPPGIIGPGRGIRRGAQDSNSYGKSSVHLNLFTEVSLYMNTNQNASLNTARSSDKVTSYARVIGCAN